MFSTGIYPLELPRYIDIWQSCSLRDLATILKQLNNSSPDTTSGITAFTLEAVGLKAVDEPLSPCAGSIVGRGRPVPIGLSEAGPIKCSLQSAFISILE